MTDQQVVPVPASSPRGRAGRRVWLGRVAACLTVIFLVGLVITTRIAWDTWRGESMWSEPSAAAGSLSR